MLLDAERGGGGVTDLYLYYTAFLFTLQVWAWPASFGFAVWCVAGKLGDFFKVVQLDTINGDDRLRTIEAEAKVELQRLRQANELAAQNALAWESAQQTIKDDLDAMRVASMNT